MPVVSGSSGRGVATSLAPLIGMQYIELESRRFPDGEGYVRVPSDAIDAIRSEPVVLVSNTYPDSGIVNTVLLLEAIADVRRGDLSNIKGEEPQSMEDVGRVMKGCQTGFLSHAGSEWLLRPRCGNLSGSSDWDAVHRT